LFFTAALYTNKPATIDWKSVVEICINRVVDNKFFRSYCSPLFDTVYVTTINIPFATN
jgi:hypothetical protein